MLKEYPVIFKEQPEGGYTAEIIDLNQVTEGDSYQEAFNMATECANSHCCVLEDEKINIPTASKLEDLKNKHSIDLFAFVTVDTNKFRKEVLNKCERINVTIPAILLKQSEGLNINKSKLFADALRREIIKQAHN